MVDVRAERDTAFFESYRREFPVTEKYAYLDHAGIAPISLRVKDAIDRFLSESAEGGAFHYLAWAHRIARVRTDCARLINADPHEIAFVKNTSHGLSLVAQGLDWKSGDNVIIYEKEFPSNIYPWLNLRRKGVEVRFLPSRDGRIAIEDIQEHIDSRTRLLSLSSIQFSNGFRTDLRRVGELCRGKDVLFCVDAIQSLGALPMDVEDCNIDFLSADAHKWMLGPEGIGIFYCRSRLAERLDPLLLGWKSVKNELDFDKPDFTLKTDALRFEEGSPNVMGIMGLGAAVELLLEVGVHRVAQRVLDLGDVIISEAEKREYRVLTPKEREARGGIVTIAGSFDPASVRDLLRDRGIMVNVRGGGLRVSPHFYNSEGDVLRLFQQLPG